MSALAARRAKAQEEKSTANQSSKVDSTQSGEKDHNTQAGTLATGNLILEGANHLTAGTPTASGSATPLRLVEGSQRPV